MPKSSAIVIWTLATCWRFHTGSSNEFANRNTSRFWTGSLPRKWFDAIDRGLVEWRCRMWLSSAAEAWSRPNGFSRPAGRPRPGRSWRDRTRRRRTGRAGSRGTRPQWVCPSVPRPDGRTARAPGSHPRRTAVDPATDRGQPGPRHHRAPRSTRGHGSGTALRPRPSGPRRSPGRRDDRTPRAWYSAGRSFLRERSPLAPNTTRTSPFFVGVAITPPPRRRAGFS